MTLLDHLRPFLSRIIGSIVGVAAAWLLARYGFSLDAQTQDAITQLLVVILTVLLVRDGTHRGLDKIVNPADTASAHLARAGKDDSAQAKLAEKEGTQS